MKINKITTGFVIQTFDTETGRFVSQEFKAGDQVDFETREGEPVDSALFVDNAGDEVYLPFDMVQPDNSKPDCAVCQCPSITTRMISINSAPKRLLPVCEIHADAADEDKEI